MFNQYKYLIIALVLVLVSAQSYSAGYVSIGGVGSHGYGQITVGKGVYGHGRLHGHGYHISGSYYSPPVVTRSYSSYCY